MDWIKQIYGYLTAMKARRENRRDFVAMMEQLWALVDELKLQLEESGRIAAYLNRELCKCRRRKRSLLARLKQQGGTE